MAHELSQNTLKTIEDAKSKKGFAAKPVVPVGRHLYWVYSRNREVYICTAGDADGSFVSSSLAAAFG
jgi:hypothetical protein